MSTDNDALSFVCVGHVDHGKSSLIGRLLMDTDSLQPEVVNTVRRISKERGKKFEYAFLLDAFQEEREQGITIDITKIEFRSDLRRYIIIDAPGHKEFLKNMASGASRAEAALLIVDAEQGVQEQTRKHAYLLSLLGITQVNVIINKMDLVEYAKPRFEQVKQESLEYLERLDIRPAHVIPISAVEGDNVSTPSKNMAWYDGPTVLQMLDSFKSQENLDKKALRLCLQDIYKFDNRRILAGRVESGTISVGDHIRFYPSKKEATVESIEVWPDDSPKKMTARAGESIGITIDQEFFLERGEVISHSDTKPNISNLIEATVFWMGHEPLRMDREYTLKLNTQQVSCRLHSITTVIDSETLTSVDNTGELGRYEVGEIVIRTKDPIVFDAFQDIETTGRFVLVEDTDVVGGGIIYRVPEIIKSRDQVNPRSKLISPKTSLVSIDERAKRAGHKGHVIWLTGLAGSGKGMIAKHLEKQLFEDGINAYLLDSSNVRMTLSSDLSFSEKQRKEHARRMAELANFLLNAGLVVIVGIVSPYAEDREYARSLIGDKQFTEVFVDTPLDICKQINPHGIYSKVERGDISGVPGVDIEYEPSERLIHTIHISRKDFDVEAITDSLAKVVKKDVR